MIKEFYDKIPEKLSSKIVKTISKVKDIDSPSSTNLICRKDLDCDEKNECIFCSINRTAIGSWYATCKLYNERLKRYGNYDIAKVCESCYKDLDKKIITYELGE